MYSVNRIEDESLEPDERQRNQEFARRHQELSPELKEVMHLLKAMETGNGNK